MRSWTWASSGPEEPDLDLLQARGDERVVWDTEDKMWSRDERGRWWAEAVLEEGQRDLGPYQDPDPLPWSVLLESRGPLRSKPRVGVPLPPAQIDSAGL